MFSHNVWKEYERIEKNLKMVGIVTIPCTGISTHQWYSADCDCGSE